MSPIWYLFNTVMLYVESCLLVLYIAMKAFFCYKPESNKWFIEEQAFSVSRRRMICLQQTTHRQTEKKIQLAEGDVAGGGGAEAISYDGEKACSSINNSLLPGYRLSLNHVVPENYIREEISSYLVMFSRLCPFFNHHQNVRICCCWYRQEDRPSLWPGSCSGKHYLIGKSRAWLVFLLDINLNKHQVQCTHVLFNRRGFIG